MNRPDSCFFRWWNDSYEMPNAAEARICETDTRQRVRDTGGIPS